MITRKICYVTTMLVSAGLTLTLPGCANMPGMPGSTTASSGDDGACSINQTAVGAVAGGGVGALVGGLATHGSTTGLLAGGLIGGALGGFLGNEQDQRCQQEAEARALAQAADYAQADEADLPVETVAQSEAPPHVYYVHHHRHYTKPAQPLPAQSYTNTQTGTKGTEVATAPYINKETGQECTNVQHSAFKTDGTTQTAVTTKCRTPPQGQWLTVADNA